MKLKKYILLFLLFAIIACESLPLKEYRDASTLRNKTIQYDLNSYSKENFEIADAKYREAIILLENKGDNKQIVTLLTDASNGYKAILDTDLPEYANVLKEEVNYEREYSKDIKAYKVDKDGYEIAELNYLTGLSALSTNNYDVAVSNFIEARKFHNKAYFTTKRKFDESLYNIKIADDKLKEVYDIGSNASTNNK